MEYSMFRSTTISRFFSWPRGIVVERNMEYDKFLSSAYQEGRERKKPRAQQDKTCIIDWSLSGSPCWQWHGPWPYCRGCCEKVSFDDIWHETLDSTAAPPQDAFSGKPAA